MFCPSCGAYNEGTATTCHACTKPLAERPLYSSFLGGIVASGQAVSEDRAAIWWRKFWSGFDSHSDSQVQTLADIWKSALINAARLEKHSDMLASNLEIGGPFGASTYVLQIRDSETGEPIVQFTGRFKDAFIEEGIALGHLDAQARGLRDAWTTRKSTKFHSP